jgi:PadR family transcriptional regulator, regulatory protein AphA
VHLWQESFGQLYPALGRLEVEGLVASRSGSQELLLKLCFAVEVGASGAARARECFTQGRARTPAGRCANSAPCSNGSSRETPGFDYYWATLRDGEFGLEAHLRWCDEVIARLGKRARHARLPRERLK